MKSYFVTGTDTGVGKTTVCAALLHAAVRRGWRAAAIKPVAAGIDSGAAANDDVLRLHAATNLALSLDEVGPVQMRHACAPHLAAALEGRTLDPGALVMQVHHFARDADLRLAEGVGGFMVPLQGPEATGYGMDDFAAALGWPVLLVVGLRLGCLNHALLTAAAVRRRGLTLAAWAGTVIDPTMTHLDGNVATLRSSLGAPCLGIVPYLAQADAAQVAHHLDIGCLIADA